MSLTKFSRKKIQVSGVAFKDLKKRLSLSDITKKTTVIFVHTDQKIQKPLVIPTFFLKNWKFFFMTSFFFIFLFLYSIYMETKSYFLEQQNQLTKEKESVQNYSNEVKEKYGLLLDQINEVNSLLESRGIQGIEESSINPEFLMMPGFSVTNIFNHFVEGFKSNLSEIPIGLPVDGQISSDFGRRLSPITRKNYEVHKGLDFKANYGDLVKSTAKGVVEFAGYRGSYGNLVIINHGNKYKTYYGHLSKILVKKNQEVDIDFPIGKVGSTGRSTGPHLHYEIRKNDKIINPINFISVE